MFPASRTDGDVDIPHRQSTRTQLPDATGEHYSRLSMALPPALWALHNLLC
jgi:hypothetical protein